MPIKKASLFLVLLFFANFFYGDLVKYVNDTFLLVEAEHLLLLLKVTFTLALLGIVYGFKISKECGLNLRVNWKTLPQYWPMALVAILILAGGIADELSVDFVIKMLILTLAVALGEELMFRGLVFYWFEKLSKNKLILLSAVSFGSMHLLGLKSDIAPEVIFAQAYFAAGFGIIFAIARSRDYSITLPILVHWMFDFVTLGSKGGVKETFAAADTSEIVIGLIFAGSISWAWGLFLLWKERHNAGKRSPATVP